MVAEGKLPASVPTNFGYVTDAAQKKAQEKLAHLVPNAKHITNTNSGHEIHKEQPQIVVDAIRDIVEVVRCGSRPPVRRTPRSGGRSRLLLMGQAPQWSQSTDPRHSETSKRAGLAQEPPFGERLLRANKRLLQRHQTCKELDAR